MQVNIATIPERESQLINTIKSLQDQVDCINLYLNNYEHLPSWLKDYNIGKTTLGDNSTADAGKFFFKPKGYVFTCDDDIIYPEGYVSKLMAGIDKYGCVCSFHGKTIPPKKIASFYRKTWNIDCKKQLEEDKKIDVPGTGVMGWHSDFMEFDFDKMTHPYMADVWAATQCKEKGVEVMCLKHPDGWIKSQKVRHLGKTIWDHQHNNDQIQTELINEAWGR